MLNDKHIRRLAEALIDETTLTTKYIQSIPDEVFLVMIDMYKRGHDDCKDKVYD